MQDRGFPSEVDDYVVRTVTAGPGRVNGVYGIGHGAVAGRPRLQYPYRLFRWRQKSRSIHLSKSVIRVALPAFIRKQHWPVGVQS